MTAMRKICFLIGFMGCGKSFWGARLAERLAVPFVDLDQLIELEEGCTIASIFDLKGERRFRQLERHYLQGLWDRAPLVVATGGGTPCFFDNMAWMNDRGITIYLRTPASLLAARIRMDHTVRPLLNATAEGELEAYISRMLEQRTAVYEQAHIILDQSGNAADFLGQLLNALAEAGPA